MPTTEINKIIHYFNLLTVEEKEYVSGVINKQLIEYRREEILRRANSAKNDLKHGNVKKGSFADLYKDLEPVGRISAA